MPIGLAGVAHVVLFGILLPLAALRTVFALRTHGWPPRAVLYRSILLQQAFFLAVSLLVARVEDVSLVFRPSAARDVGLGVLGALVLAAALWPVWRRSVARRDERIVHAAPRTGRDLALWGLVSLAAGVAEEVAYRGVMFALLHRVTGSPVAAAVLAAIAFGVGHSVQGRGGIAAVSAIALLFHGVTWITGSLAGAIVMHTLYDLLAGAGMRVLAGGADDLESPAGAPEEPA